MTGERPIVWGPDEASAGESRCNALVEQEVENVRLLLSGARRGNVMNDTIREFQHARFRDSRPAARSPEQLWEQYVVEKELAGMLRAAPRAQRARLYSWAYDELFRRIPHHPQLRIKASPEEQSRRIAQQMRLLDSWLEPETVFLEIGAGDCALSFAVAKRVARVYAVDVSTTITSAASLPPNFELLLSDGTSIPTPDGKVTLAYSNQLMEHLHPEDAYLQLTNICSALAPGGTYICITPGRLTGPHDISKYFDDVATGFHLKEYTSTELITMFRRAGFRTARQWLRIRGAYVGIPNFLSMWMDRILERRRPLARGSGPARRLLRRFSEIHVIATR